MSRRYFIDCSLNNEYETKIQIEMKLSYDKHDNEIDDNSNMNVNK